MNRRQFGQVFGTALFLPCPRRGAQLMKPCKRWWRIELHRERIEAAQHAADGEDFGIRRPLGDR